MIAADKLIQFDALSFYKKYNDIFGMDDVPEAERKQVAQSVAEWVLTNMDKPALPVVSSGCSAEAQQTPSCCSR